MRMAAGIAALAFSLGTAAAAGGPEGGPPLVVTETGREAGRAWVVFNRTVRVDDLRVGLEGGHPAVRWPEYSSARTKRIYPQITFASPTARRRIEAAVLQGAPEFGDSPGRAAGRSPSDIPPLETRVTRVQKLGGHGESSTSGRPAMAGRHARAANVDLTLNGAVTVVCGVMRRPDGTFWVAWPAKREGDGAWVNQVTWLQEEARAAAEAKVLARYHESVGAARPAARP